MIDSFERDYCAPEQIALRDRSGASVCIDLDCDLSGGMAHVGPCEPCCCGKRHAIEECLETAAADEVASIVLEDRGLMEREKLGPNDRHPLENFGPPYACRGCGKPILPANRRIADGCPCNSVRGINHGLVAKNTCTCVECDPAQTGSTRIGT